MPQASNISRPELAGKQYYQPTDRGLEKQIGQKLDYLHELDQPESPTAGQAAE